MIKLIDNLQSIEFRNNLYFRLMFKNFTRENDYLKFFNVMTIRNLVYIRYFVKDVKRQAYFSNLMDYRNSTD